MTKAFNGDVQSSAAQGAVPVFDQADKMRKALRVSGIGVQDMADYLGVSRNTVGTWINGRIIPSRQTILLWAMRTGVPAGWLLDSDAPNDGPNDGAECPRQDSNLRPARYEVVTSMRRVAHLFPTTPAERHSA